MHNGACHAYFNQLISGKLDNTAIELILDIRHLSPFRKICSVTCVTFISYNTPQACILLLE